MEKYILGKPNLTLLFFNSAEILIRLGSIHTVVFFLLRFVENAKFFYFLKWGFRTCKAVLFCTIPYLNTSFKFNIFCNFLW
jgi:hypothetical protein